MSDIVDKIDETLKDVLGDERVQTVIGLALLYQVLRTVISYVLTFIMIIIIIIAVLWYVP